MLIETSDERSSDDDQMGFYFNNTDELKGRSMSYATPRTGVEIPATQGFFSKRVAYYSSVVRADAIETVLGHDPRSKFWKKNMVKPEIRAIYEHIQRATTPSRLHGIENYIDVRMSSDSPLIGAFPAVSVAIQYPVEFIDPDATGVGKFRLDLSTRNNRIVIDGIGRLSGVLEILDKSYDESYEEFHRAKALMENFTVPVVFYTPCQGTKPFSIEEMGQLFFDYNYRAVALSARQAVALDQSDPYILATRQLAEISEAIEKGGGMAAKLASVGPNNPEIVVQVVLLKMVRGAMEGDQAQDTNNFNPQSPKVTLSNVTKTATALARFVDVFARSMGDKFFDKSLLHLSSPGWQSLGRVYYRLKFVANLSDEEILRSAGLLGTLDWSRSAEMWEGIITRKINHKTGVSELVLTGAGATTKREMTQRLLNNLQERQRISFAKE